MGTLHHHPFLSRYQGGAGDHVVQIRAGRAIRTGVGQSFWLRNGRCALAEMPTANRAHSFLIQAATAEAATRLFKEIYAALPLPPGEPEPMMNIFGSYYDNNWVITVIPRKRHRPWQYEAEGHDHLLSSPGAADIGGLFITPLEKDFKKINPELLRDVYQQVCLSDRDVEEIFVHLSSN